ncbi:lipopolysaccharide biosynthesis protein [Akkermansiaceae bacterium]|nr:lipopolysaccharide biosynthesis protein [bacterium]MDC1205959.1 lipopolysaccharide biosynthesis protein [Akkermansiaceae bacterium]
MIRLGQKIRSGVVWAGVESWANQIITLVVFTILAREVSPESFGIIALASVLIAFCQIFVEAGWGAALVQRKNLEDEHYSAIFWISIVMATTLVGVCFVSAPLFAEALKESQLTSVVRWLSVSILFSSFSLVSQARLHRFLRFRELALCRLFGGVVGGTTGVVLAYMGYGVWALVSKQMVGVILMSVGVCWIEKWRPGLNLSWIHVRDLMKFSIYQSGNHILVFINSRLDQLFVGVFLGSHVLGLYSVGRRMILIVLDLLTSVATKVCFPVFSALQEDAESYARVFLKAIRFTARLSFPAMLGLAAIAPICIPVIFGEKWSGSIEVMQVIAIGSVLQSVSIINYSAIVAKGRPGVNLLFHSIAILIDIVLYVTVLPYGILVFSVFYSCRLVISSFLSYFVLQRVTGIRVADCLRVLCVPLILSVIMASCVVAIQKFGDFSLPHVVTLILLIVVGLLVYGILAAKFYSDVSRYICARFSRPS